jgi:hypothetical protein
MMAAIASMKDDNRISNLREATRWTTGQARTASGLAGEDVRASEASAQA